MITDITGQTDTCKSIRVLAVTNMMSRNLIGLLYTTNVRYTYETLAKCVGMFTFKQNWKKLILVRHTLHYRFLL